MKGSAAFRSLKSWAFGLHQQLPLNPKESQRLLNALTSSFRRHLDKVHPSNAESVPVAETLQETSTAQSMHAAHYSSAALADRHLASILTNPLIAKSASPAAQLALAPEQAVLDDEAAARAKRELEKDNVQDPLALLERYQQEGMATVLLGQVCMEHFEALLKNLTIPEQEALVLKVQPGKRILAWLWGNELHKTSAFVDNLKFIQLLVFAVMREGLDAFLWSWLEMDMRLGEDVLSAAASRGAVQSLSSTERHRNSFRWKSRILRHMIDSKVFPPFSAQPSLDDAVGIALRAHDIPNINLYGACLSLRDYITWQRHLHGDIDVKLYDTYVEMAHLRVTDRGTEASAKVRQAFSLEREQAVLSLYHPTRPDVDMFLHLLRFIRDPASSTLQPGRMLKAGIAWRSVDRVWMNYISRTIYLLRQMGRDSEAQSLQDQLLRSMPSWERKIEAELAHLQRHGHHTMSREQLLQYEKIKRGSSQTGR